jgi:hypothetical protein
VRERDLSRLGDCSLRALPTSEFNPNKINRGKDDGPKHECTADTKTHKRRRTIDWNESVRKYEINNRFWNNLVDNSSEKLKWCYVHADSVKEGRKSKSQYTQSDCTGHTDRNGPEERNSK